MARQQRSTTLVQESTAPIARVALYARVSTVNNQDPEMQLAEQDKRGAPSTRGLRMDVIWADRQKMVIQTE